MLSGNQSQYAAHRSVSRKTATVWKQRGLLVLTPSGDVDFEASDQSLREHGLLEPEVTDPETDEAVAKVLDRMIKSGEALLSKVDAERVKENYAALLKHLEFDRKVGAVAEIEHVVVAVASEFALVRNKLLNIGSRLAPRVAVLKSAEEIKALIDAEVILALEELTLDAPRETSFDVLRGSLQKRFRPDT